MEVGIAGQGPGKLSSIKPGILIKGEGGGYDKNVNINKNCFSCFKHGECIMSILTSATKQVLTFVKTVLTCTISEVNFYTSTKIKTQLL